MNEIDKLVEFIKYHQDKYYNGEPEISDAEFDRAWDRLEKLDPNNPILHKVGSDSGNFPKARHIIPMGSQNKARNIDEFKKWYNKYCNISKAFLVEFKLDGSSIELLYKNGEFVQAITRGDGIVGDDVTFNVSKMKGVIPYLENKFTGSIRGEVLLFKEDLKKYFPNASNCRNGANGVMKRLDGVGCEHLNVIVYDVIRTDNVEFDDEYQKLGWLDYSGFNVVNTILLEKSKDFDMFKEIIKLRNITDSKRNKLDYDIDGLVIKTIEIDREDAKRDRPNKQIAFKFDIADKVTTLREVEWSSSGKYKTPIAVCDPVPLNGTIVKRANLCNPNMIKSLGIKIGSKIAIAKQGEIIPKIQYCVETPNNAVDIMIPTKCECCGSKLINEGTSLYCPNKNCDLELIHHIQKWIDVQDIRNIGPQTVELLFNSGKIKTISDLYRLDYNDFSGLLKFDGVGKMAIKIVDSIQSKKEVTLEKFVAGLDIDDVGEKFVELITKNIKDKTIKGLQSLDIKDLIVIKGIEEKKARIFVEGLKERKEEIDNLINIGIKIINSKLKNDLLKGKSFCFTGELDFMTRKEAFDLVKSLGGEVRTSVSNNLSYLVNNYPNSTSSKNTKAKELGIDIITERKFMEMIEEFICV